MIDTSIDAILLDQKKKGKIKVVPENNVQKIDEMKRVFKKDKNFQKVLEFYEMLRKIESLRMERIGEFRKNVCLKISYRGEIIEVNLEQLKIYADMLEKFISTTKQLLLS
ncbi:MAG: hypothetical protein KC516_02895 [Nanoarchaeota archaeon]|nr:hypothetical protein [Nanoarchaeota archaeon]